jgi:hypothetical protein
VNEDSFYFFGTLFVWRNAVDFCSNSICFLFSIYIDGFFMNTRNTLDRLKVLFEERYMEHHDIDRWNEAIENEWPKILNLIEAGDALASNLKPELNYEDVLHLLIRWDAARKALG